MTIRSTCLTAAASLGLLAAPQAQAAPTLLGIGTLTGSADLSGLAGNMENGMPANVLGGLGSGFTTAGGNTFLALPDRGPNATVYNAAVDSTVTYIPRFQTLTMDITSNGGPGLPLTITPTLTGTTLLWNGSPLTYGSGSSVGLGSGAPAQNTGSQFYFSGRSDNFNPAMSSANPNNARLDPESIRVSNNGAFAYVSDEYGPYVYEFNRATGERTRTFTLPTNLNVATQAPTGAAETAANTSGRTPNQGMEGLAITPDGKTLVGTVQSALIQDKALGGAAAKLVRIVTIDIATGTTHEYAYQLTSGTGVSEIVALNDHEFLVDERDGTGQGNGDAAVVKRVYKIDLNGATDITAMDGTEAATHAVSKTQFLDVVAALNAKGIASTDIPSKIEGMSFGSDVTVDGTLYHTLWITNDNDYLPGTAGDNRFYLFGFTGDDLGGSLYAPQQVPEPATLGLLSVGLLGLFGAVRRRK
ncbi:MAG: esterase-like activity of phytase family protein [Acetobacteraceae bacterium]